MDQKEHNVEPSASQDLHCNSVQDATTLVDDVLLQCPASSSCAVAQPPIILSSDLSELTSKFEGDGLIKVDTMLGDSCKYLEEVSAFGADDGEGNASHGLVNDKIQMAKSVQVLKKDNLENVEEILMVNNTGDETLKGPCLRDNEGVGKDTRMNLLDSSPFLMNEEGVVFQCFPVFEKEVFIVSLEEEALLMNDSLAVDHRLPVGSDHSNELKLGSISAPAKQGREITDFDLKSRYPLLDAPVTNSYAQNAPTSSFMAFHDSERTYDAVDPRTVLRETSASSLDRVVSPKSVPANAINTAENQRNNNASAAPFQPNFQQQQEDMKVTHATIYAPPPKRARKGPVDNGEPMLELYKCPTCSEALPTSATLKHHLITRHQEKNLDSFVCFICKQDCWNSSQQDWHLRIQHGIKNKTLACLVCGTQFSTPTEFKAHVRKHPVNLTCPTCPQRFASQHQLTQHVKKHLEELQPHSCEVCGIRFTHPKVLELHAWRHKMQKCMEESCEYVAEDETWLFYHFQEHHKYSSQSILSLTMTRNADEYRLDILLKKYSQLQQQKVNPASSNTHLAKSNRLRKKNAAKEDDMPVNFVKVDGDSSIPRESLEISSSVFSDVISAVVSVEEEEKKNVKRKVQILRKVFDGGTSHRCGLCNTYFSSAEELTMHRAEHNQVLECSKCKKSFQSVKQLKRHMTVHSSQRNGDKQHSKGMNEHECIVCGKVFGSESALSRHSSTHARSEGRHQCHVCSKRVGTRAHLTEHLTRVHKIHNESKKMQCPMCDRRFISRCHLNLHLITHGEGKPLHTCKVCKRNYLHPRSLQRHMATHDETYNCSTCNESFPSARHLAIHVRSHDPSYKSKVPCPNCPLAFSYKSQLEVHLRTHTGEKPYVCETCGKAFKRLQHCTVHLKVMHGNEKEACKECGKPFRDKTNLLRHRLKVHYNLNRWVCGMCAQSFAYSEDLRRHLKKKHNLAFERLVSTNKKCMTEVYVIPELGTQDISSETWAAIECICAAEKQKVREIFSGRVPDLTRPLPDSGNVGADTNRDLTESAPLRENSVTTTPVYITSGTVGVPTVMENRQLQSGSQSNSNITTFVNNEVQGLMSLPVSGMKCTECGVNIINPHQCGTCGVVVCSQAHLNVHSASVHQVLFQCSVCHQRYNTQSECVAHITSVHSSQLFAVQGATGTYLPTGQPQVLQNNNMIIQPQLCLPLPQTQSNSQCLVQVGGCAPQLPVLVAPANNLGSQQQQLTAPTNVLPYTNVVNGLASGIPVIPQASALEPSSNLSKQAMFTMANVFSEHQSIPTIQSGITSQIMKKELPVGGAPLCPMGLPASNPEGFHVPPNENGAVVLSTKPCTNMMPDVLPHASTSNEVPSILVRDSEFCDEDNKTPVLLIDSGLDPTVNAVDNMPQAVLSQKGESQVNMNHQQTSTSVASVLLTLSEPPHGNRSPMLMSDGGLGVTSQQVDEVLSPSVTTDVSLDVGLTAQPEGDASQQLSASLSENIEVSEEAEENKSPKEISVEIFQAQVPNPNPDSPSKYTYKKSSTSRIKRRKTYDSSPNGTHECKTCGKVLSTGTQLKKHETTHGIRRFKCQICEKAFTEKYNLKIHTLTHTQERPHECNLCQKTFRYLRDLVEHKRMHEGKRPHVCDVCQKAFIRQRDLTRHQKEQHDARRYQCKICCMTFKRRLYLQTVHMRNHHSTSTTEGGGGDVEVKPKESVSAKPEAKQSHICPTCGRNFARARYLTAHMRTHSRRASYVKCPLCPRMFSSEQMLKVHKEAFHNHDSGLQATEDSFLESDNILSNFDHPHTDNLVISDAQDISEGPATLIVSPSPNVTQIELHPSKQSSVLPSVALPTSAQPSGTAARGNGDLKFPAAGERICHFDVNMDDCDPITYLGPSFVN